MMVPEGSTGGPMLSRLCIEKEVTARSGEDSCRASCEPFLLMLQLWWLLKELCGIFQSEPWKCKVRSFILEATPDMCLCIV